MHLLFMLALWLVPPSAGADPMSPAPEPHNLVVRGHDASGCQTFRLRDGGLEPLRGDRLTVAASGVGLWRVCWDPGDRRSLRAFWLALAGDTRGAPQPLAITTEEHPLGLFFASNLGDIAAIEVDPASGGVARVRIDGRELDLVPDARMFVPPTVPVEVLLRDGAVRAEKVPHAHVWSIPGEVEPLVEVRMRAHERFAWRVRGADGELLAANARPALMPLRLPRRYFGVGAQLELLANRRETVVAPLAAAGDVVTLEPPPLRPFPVAALDALQPPAGRAWRPPAFVQILEHEDGRPLRFRRLDAFGGWFALAGDAGMSYEKGSVPEGRFEAWAPAP